MIDFSQLWSWFDWLLVAAYFVGVIVIGFVMRRRASKNMKNFFVAARRLTIPVLVGVAFAGWCDSWTIVGMAECGTTMGISIVFVWLIPCGIAKLPLALWVGPLVRQRMPDWVITMPDIIEYMYNKGTRIVMAIGMIAPFLYESSLLMAGGTVIHYITGVNVWIAFGILGIIICLYTSMSGMWGLAVSDMIQFTIMTVCAGFMCFGMIQEFGSYDAIFEGVKAINPVFVEPWGGMNAIGVFAWMIGALAMYANSQSYQRFGSGKTPGDIKVAYSLVLMFYVVFAMVFAIAGMAALVKYPDFALDDPTQAFWGLVFNSLPIGVRGLFLAAVLSAIMSTASADYLILGAVVVHDLLMNSFGVKFTARGEVRAQKITIWIFGLLMIVATLFWADGIAKAYYYCGGFQVAAFFFPLLGGLFYKKKTPQAGFWALLLTIPMYVIWEFVLGAPGGIPSNAFCIVFSAAIFFFVSAVTYPSFSKKVEAMGGIEAYEKAKEVEMLSRQKNEQ